MRVKVKAGHLYFYEVGEALPTTPLSGDELGVHIDVLNTLLRHDHEYNYCSIFFADNMETPTPYRWELTTKQAAIIENHVPLPNN